MAYRGVIARAVDAAVKGAVQEARRVHKRETGQGSGDAVAHAGRPASLVHISLAEAARVTAAMVRTALDTWLLRARTAATVAEVPSLPGGLASAGEKAAAAAGADEATTARYQRGRGLSDKQRAPAALLKGCEGRLCAAKEAACLGKSRELIHSTDQCCPRCAEAMTRADVCSSAVQALAALSGGVQVVALALSDALQGRATDLRRAVQAIKTAAPGVHGKLPRLRAAVKSLSAPGLPSFFASSRNCSI